MSSPVLKLVELGANQFTKHAIRILIDNPPTDAVTSPVCELDKDGFIYRLTLFPKTLADAQSLISEWLCKFEVNVNQFVLFIQSVNTVISASDAAIIIRLVLRDADLEIIQSDSDFINGVIVHA